MNIEILSEASVICSNRDSFHNYFAWPSVIRLPDGNLVMGASGYRLRHICPFGKAVMSYSFNEGKTWTRPAIIADTPLDDRDCGLAVFGEKVIFTTFNNRTELQRLYNDDEKQAFYHSKKESYVEAYLDKVDESGTEDKYYGSLYAVSNDGGYNFEKLKKADITAPHGPCVTADGKVIYIGRRFSQTFDDRSQSEILCYTMNGNEEFELTGSIDNICIDGDYLMSCEPHAVVMPDGKIVVHIRAQGRVKGSEMFTLFQSESYDGGKTFSKPHQILGEIGGAPAHLLLHSSGVLISAYGYRGDDGGKIPLDKKQPYGIRVMFSKDGGETWDIDNILYENTANPDLGYPCSVELKDGSILTVFYAHEQKESPAEIYQTIWRICD